MKQVLRPILAFKETLHAYGIRGAHVLAALAISLFIIQIANQSYFISALSDSRPVIAGLDNDGANAIDVASRSTWVTDNGFASYGPVYFRISSTVAWLVGNLSEPGALEPIDARTKSIHFSLMLTSAISLALLSLLFARLLVNETYLAIFLAIAINRALLHSPAWQGILLRPHPDHLLAFLTALACVLTAQLWISPEHRSKFRLSAWAWGVALATKLSLVLFMPFVLLGFFLTAKSNRIKAGIHYVLHMILAYMVIGFPQNFNLPRLFRFLKYQSTVNERGDLSTISEWFQLWTTQLAPALLVIALVVATKLVQKTPWKTYSWRVVLPAVALAFGPFLLLLPQKVLVPHDYYPMPMVASQIALLIVVGGLSIQNTKRAMSYALIAIILLALIPLRLVPEEMNTFVTERLVCRPETRAIFSKIVALEKEGRKIYVDPYVPTQMRSTIVSSWKTNKKLAVDGAFDVLVLKPSYFQRYLEDSGERYAGTYNHDYQSTRAFYQIFQGKEQASDPDLGQWARTHNDPCDYQIWQKKQN